MKKRLLTPLVKFGGIALLGGVIIPSQAAPSSVLWWDSTPEYGSQAPDALRKAMSDYLSNFGGGSLFNSTYVSSEVPGTLATQLANNSYDVIVFDATSQGSKFNAADIAAIQNHYANNNKNLLLDGTLYIRSINYNATTIFPGVNNSTGGLVVNEVAAIASRGGGIMIGTDHNCCQTDANEALQAILPGASFSGITYPSTDGVFYGSDLLNGPQPIAAVDIFNHWDSVPTEGIAPTAVGVFTDFQGGGINLYSQVDDADDPGGGPKYSYISTSWAPGSGTTVVTDPNVGGNNGVPDVGATAAMLLISLGVLSKIRK